MSLAWCEPAKHNLFESMNRTLVLAALGLAGIAATVSAPVLRYARMREAEHAAVATLLALRDAQRVFRQGGGRGAYATDLASLTTPCPGDAAAALARSDLDGNRYTVRVRAARRAAQVGQDCHGRATANDFYAAAAPRRPPDGRQAMALTSRGRIYVFFDGIPPLEPDMAAGGLAVALDALEGFKIP